jgi:hypothetical protein
MSPTRNKMLLLIAVMGVTSYVSDGNFSGDAEAKKSEEYTIDVYAEPYTITEFMSDATICLWKDHDVLNGTCQTLNLSLYEDAHEIELTTINYKTKYHGLLHMCRQQPYV